MLLIFFFYGLAFIVMGIVIFTMPKRNDFLEISDDIWLIGLFGIVHGINEWVDLLILMGGPIDQKILNLIGSILLPTSFLFMAIFGCRVISKKIKQLHYLKHAWIMAFAAWAVASAAGHSAQASGIFARYFICFPGVMLSALGLYVAMEDCKKNNTPDSVCIFTRVTVAALVLYSIASGLVTPVSGFFPASLVNYDNFLKYTGFPVQLLRMLLAVVLAICFFCITNIFHKTTNTILITGGIRRKTSFIITITATITLITSISLVSLVSYFVIKNNVGKEKFEIARTLALDAAENIADQVKDIMTYSSRSLWRKACEKANSRYSGMDKFQIEKMMRDMDIKWARAGEEDAQIKECDSGEIPDSMREIIQIQGNISEIFMTDKFGGLACSAGRTSDFYQADEDWWQKTFNGGKGAVYFGGIEFNISSGKWGSAIANPIINSSGEVIGVCKVFVQIEGLFDFLDKFRSGTTMHALLLDEDGNILLHESKTAKAGILMERNDFERLKNAANSNIYAKTNLDNKEVSVIAICPIDSEFLRNNGIVWSIAITQQKGEALGLLKIFFLLFLLMALFFTPLVVPIGAAIGGKFAKPIDDLSKAASRIATGELDQKINIRTGDEIEQFAETFKNMLFAIKVSRSNLVRAKEDLEKLTVNQESLIEDRTSELSRAQEATLNILEDLVEAKDGLEKYAKELEEAVRAKTDFTATVSHELRTPLAAIKEGIAIVLDGTAGHIEPKQKEFLEIARRNVDRLARLINDLLDFQKLEAGRMEFDIKSNDINAVVKETAGAMAAMAEIKGLELKLDLGKDLPAIEFDKNRIEQVLANLISNAIRYTDKGSITLRTEKKDNFVKVSVKDTGVGIRKEDMPRLFQRFSQLEPVSDRRVGGTGLGLAISKEIIDFHKGKMVAESEPGVGSTFSFILPIQERRGSV